MNNTINKGKILTIVIKPPAVIMFQVNPDKIANNKCPAVIFAANRTPKDIALAPWEINSIITKKGANQRGAPAGINIAKKYNLYVWKPIIVQPKNILKLKPKVTAIWEVGVNV